MSAVVVAPDGFVDVVIVRGCEGDDAAVACGCDEDEAAGDGVAFPCWMAEWALNAARKFAKKGRCVGMLCCAVSIFLSSAMLKSRGGIRLVLK